MARKLTTIPSGMPVLDRIQENLRSTLNPVLARRVLSDDPPPSVTGATGGNAALKSLLSALEAMGLIRDETT